MHSDSTQACGHVLYWHVHEKPLPWPYRCQGPVYNTVQRYRIDVLFVVITVVACQVQRHAPSGLSHAGVEPGFEYRGGELTTIICGKMHIR